MTSSFETEAQRNRDFYSQRDREFPADFYARYFPANLFMRHSQERAIRDSLSAVGMLPLTGRRVAEVGCGAGDWLTLVAGFGVKPQDMLGVDLSADRVAACTARFPGADLRVGNAVELPWEDGSIDLVMQSTVFSNMKDPQMKRAGAAEMLRVMRPGGAVLWYDLRMNNPKNPHIQAIGARELRSLFPGCRVRVRRVTLAPPLARRVVPISWTLATMLEALRLLNSHLVAVVTRPV